MLVRASQVGRKLEGTEGTEETLLAAHFSGNFKRTPEFSLTVNNYERELVSPSLTPREGLRGQRTGMVKIVQELVGGGAATAAPWHTDLQAMGFAATAVKVVTIGAVTNGPYTIGTRIGDNATEGSATKTGIVVKQLGTKLYYVPVTGTFAAADVIYGYTSPQPSATQSGAAADAGWRIKPVTETDSALTASATVECRTHGNRYTLIGARATGSLSIRLGEPLLLTAEYRGVPVFDTDGVTFRTASAMASVPALATAPRVAKGITLAFRITGSSDYTPILTELGIDLANTLAPRPTIAGDLALSGHLATRITDRKYMTRIDPEMVAPGTFNYVKRFTAGDTFGILADVGLPSDVNGNVIVWSPAAQLEGDLSFGDRDGRATVPASALLSGSGDDEIEVYHLFGS